MTDGWTLGASSFNWTPDIIRAERTAAEIVAGIASSGVADTLELEAGQALRSFPEPDAEELDALRDAVAAAGGRISILGASIDDFTAGGGLRSDEERWTFLIPQLHAAHRLGAAGVRLPIGQAGRP